MDDAVLTWTFPNWITVVLMVAVGFGILSVIQSYVAKKKGE